MKLFTRSVLSAALLAAAGAAQAGETAVTRGAPPVAAPAETNPDESTWLVLAGVSLADGEVTALQSCLEEEMLASLVSSFARKLEAVAMPTEPSQPWLSCGEAGCP